MTFLQLDRKSRMDMQIIRHTHPVFKMYDILHCISDIICYLCQ